MSDNEEVVVLIVDDEPEVSAALVWLLASMKITARAFAQPDQFLLALAALQQPACAVLDLRMPGISGIELLQKIRDAGFRLPVLFLSAHGDVPAAVHAMQLGAIDFLQKPFNSQVFLDSINRAIRLARETHAMASRSHATEARLAKLSPRERDVLNATLEGQTSKEIGKSFGISPKTVDVHRANVMRKMDAENYRDLVRIMNAHQF